MDDPVQDVRRAQRTETPAPSRPAKASRPKAPAYPESVDRLISEFNRLPGIGRRTAERLAFHILKSDPDAASALASAITEVKRSIRHCSVCFNLTEVDPCAICADPARDHTLVLVVEQPKDLIALEQTGIHKGVYHVLLGRISPLDGIGPNDLTIPGLFKRIDQTDAEAPHPRAGIREVILGLNPTLEGDGTAMHIAEHLRHRGLRVSRLARGLPTGWQLEYANKAVLADAIQCRQEVE